MHAAKQLSEWLQLMPAADGPPTYLAGIPVDIVALAVPVTAAACAFSFVIFRAFAYDPEW